MLAAGMATAAKKSRKSSANLQGAGGARGRGRWLLALGAILGLTFLAYVPSLENGYVHWDDNYYVTENPLLARPSLHALLTTPIAANWHPLTVASLLVNYSISGLNPASYHWLNLLLHLANTAFVFVFVRALSRDRFWTSLATSLFFGVHPMHVESVAWIAERKDVLYSFFYLIAMIVYLRYLETKKGGWLWVALLTAAFSIASKPAAVVLPLTLLAIDYFRRRPLSKRLVLEKVPFFALSAASGFLNLHVQRSFGALTVPHTWDPFERLLFASYAIVTYVVKLFVPIHLSAVYPYPTAGTLRIPQEFYLAFAALAILLPAVVVLFRRNRVVLFGLAFFFINIVLVLQLVTVGTAVLAERYTYLPYIGLLLALSWWLDDAPGVSLKPFLAGYLVILLPFSMVQTWKRCAVWHDPETFWSDTIRNHPGQVVAAYYNRGNYYRRTGRLEEARRDYAQALALNPQIVGIWYNQGIVLARMGQEDSAIVYLDHVLDREPNRVYALNDRGALRLRKGNLDGAVDDFSRAIELEPRSWNAYSNRALAYSKMHAYEKAVADRMRAIELDPQNRANAAVLEQQGDDLRRLSRYREAVAAYDRAIALGAAGDERLGDYYLGRSRAWAALHEESKALDDIREAQKRGAKVDAAYVRSLGG